jgi:hypothetical protein
MIITKGKECTIERYKKKPRLGLGGFQTGKSRKKKKTIK